MLNLGNRYNRLRYILSARGHRERGLAAEVMARQLPPDQVRAVQERHSGVISKGEVHRKWLDVEYHMRRAVRDATTLGLEESQPLNILDIGCGAGYFIAVARHLGHNITGLDMSDNEVFNDFVALMTIPRVVHCITPYTPLPDFASPFNLITGFQVRFNWKTKRERWTHEEWSYFLNDCRSRLATGGRMRLQLNSGKDARYRYLPEETVTRLREVPGATIPADKRTITVAA
ncbi:MAG: class I SAM-dependent methyltransferase [Gammaproteobacteria bacterium]